MRAHFSALVRVAALAGLGAWLLMILPAASRAVDFQDTRLLHQPAVSDQHIAFAYAGDLWLAHRDGSNARRVTSHEGDETSPRFSPDGRWLAFSAQYDGNTDVFLAPVAGGAPRRLTWHPSADLVQGFTPDGSAVLFASNRSVFTNRHLQLFTISVGGEGLPERLPIPHGLRASFSPDGKKIAYIPLSEAFFQWKNYRGGRTSRIWILDLDDHTVEQVPQPEGRCNDTDPVWVGDTIWFRSDRNGEFNLFSFATGRGGAEGDVAQHTQFDDFPLLRLTGSHDTLIFEQAGYLHLFDPAAGSSQRLHIGVIDDLDELRPRWVRGPEWIRSASISPKGKRLAFGYRGEVLTLPAKEGDVHNLTNSPGAHDRFPAWSPDGSRIAYFSDLDGEYRLHVRDLDEAGRLEVFDLGGSGFYEEPSWSPDSTKISFVDNSWSLFVLDLASREVKKVASEPHYGPTPFRSLEHDWSPDSRWLAYSVNTRAYVSTVHVYDTKEDRSHQITDGLSDARDPVFDRGGQYLYFFASTDAGPVKHWFAMSNADMELTSSIYLVVLGADRDSPLAPRSDEVESDETENEADESEGDGEGEAKAVVIDFAGIGQRILALPVQSASYDTLEAGKEGTILYLRQGNSPSGPPGRPSGELLKFDLESREEESLISGIDGFEVSADAKKLVYVAGDHWGIGDAGAKIDRSETKVAVDKLETRIDPQAEWKQIFHEAWRINRDYFYDPNMHGADWAAMAEQYSELLSDLTTRDDLNRLIQWMCSELAVGHHGVGGGDDRTSAERVPGGLLGADYQIDGDRYRFAKVYGGLNWNPDLRSPLTEPGVSVTAGEYLLAVNGRDLRADENLYGRFENTADKLVELTVGPDPSGEGARKVRVVPVSSENALRNRDWVEGNLKKVDAATGGRVAYVYVPNTTNLGHTYFKRYFFPQIDKQAIIVDERFNGGGQVADYYIDHLRKPLISYWATRYGDDVRTPSASIQGPKVMIIDETAGSGGDLLPWMFHKLGLGTLVGKRTWGGLVGVLGFPVLMDGGSVTAPNLAIWTEDGFVVENAGVPPDIEVEQWPADILAGRDPQLEKAIEIVLEQLEANPPPSVLRPPYPIRARP